MQVVLLFLIFIRPFISSLAFPSLNYLYTVALLIFLIFYFVYIEALSSKLSYIKYPLLFFFLGIIFSILLSRNKLNSLNEFYVYISGLSLFVISATLDHRNKIRLINTIILSAFVISLLAIYQYIFGFQNLLNYMAQQKIIEPFALDYISQRRVFFPFITPNILAGYLAMVMPLCLINKRWSLLILPISIIALLLTKSIGALLSLFFGFTMYFALLNNFKKKQIIILIAILLILGSTLILRSTTHKQHIQPIFSTLMRLSYWKNSLIIIKAHPLSGTGLGNFNLPQCRYAHNSYLQIWAEMGLLGIISFLWLIISIVKQSLKNIWHSDYKNEYAALLSAISIFLIHNFIDFSFFLPEVSFIWWIILGLSFCSLSFRVS